MSKPGNRPNVFPALKYQNAKQAIDLLVNAFGFEKSAVHAGDGDMVAHAELKLGAGTVMLGSDAKNRRTRGTRCASASTCRSTTSRPITPAPRRPAPGSGGLWPIPITARECSAYDSEGNLWSFGTYHPDDK